MVTVLGDSLKELRQFEIDHMIQELGFFRTPRRGICGLFLNLLSFSCSELVMKKVIK